MPLLNTPEVAVSIPLTLNPEINTPELASALPTAVVKSVISLAVWVCPLTLTPTLFSVS